MKWSPEQLVQLACVDFTRVMCPSVLLSASQNGIYVSSKSAGFYIARQKRLGLLPGELDLLLTWPNKNILFCELKSKDGTTTDSQDEVIARRQSQGFDCFVAHSIDEYVSGLQAYGVPIRSGFYAGIGQL